MTELKEDEEVTVRLVLDVGYRQYHQEEVIMLRSDWESMSEQDRCEMAAESMWHYVDCYAELVEV